MTPLDLAIFLLGLLLVVVTSVFVAVPLLRTGLTEEPVDEQVERERLERQKREAFAAIKEVELDYQMGKISDEDLAAMRTRFERDALEAMAALERRGRRA
jgi:hypothetical protein